MPPPNKPLPPGYSPVAPGQIVNAVTYLEMCERPAPMPTPSTAAALALQRLDGADLTAYRAIYRGVGQQWLWSSRLIMTDEELRSILTSPGVEAYILTENAQPIGLLELDFRRQGECELKFFGLVEEAIGRGAGRYLMNEAITRAWSTSLRRFWVHTCTFDHPSAVGFYQRSGFRPYAFAAEVIEDPRLRGILPRTAAPHVPLIEPSRDDAGGAPSAPGEAFDIVETAGPAAFDYDGVLAPLVVYNNEKAGPSNYQPYGCLLRDRTTGATIGGLLARSLYDWMYVELLAVPEALRRRRIGTELMTRAEAASKAAPVRGHLARETYGFQARGFYEKLGFEAFGTIEDHPRGSQRIFLRKKLQDTRS